MMSHLREAGRSSVVEHMSTSVRDLRLRVRKGEPNIFAAAGYVVCDFLTHGKSIFYDKGKEGIVTLRVSRLLPAQFRKFRIGTVGTVTLPSDDDGRGFDFR